MSATTFDLLRHGKTLWNETGRIQGRCDSPLCPTGLDQVRAWARFLARSGTRWDLILASPLGRARQTAALLNEPLALPLVFAPALQEQDWGLWTGRTLASLRREAGDELDSQVARGWDFQPPGGESRRQVLARAGACLARWGLRRPGARILVVSHEGVLKCLCYHLAGRAFLPDEPPLLRPRHIHRLRWERTGDATLLANHLHLP